MKKTIKVTFRNAGDSQVLDSAFTGISGTFDLNMNRPFDKSALLLIKIKDINGPSDEEFNSKDTLISAVPGKNSLEILLREKASGLRGAAINCYETEPAITQ